MNNNKEAFEYSHDLFKNDGYDGDLNKFSELLNVGKTPAVVEEVATVTAEDDQATVTDSTSVDGSSESVEVEETEGLSTGEQIKLFINSTSGLPGMGGASFLTDKLARLAGGFAGFGEALFIDTKKSIIVGGLIGLCIGLFNSLREGGSLNELINSKQL